MPKEDKIFGEFTDCPLAPLEGVSIYEYMTNLNIYLNLCSSAVNCTLVCGTLCYLVLTAHSAVFSTHCGTPFLPPTITDIHLVMPNPSPTAAIFLNLSEPTSTTFLYLTNIMHSIGHLRRSSVS